MSEKEEQKNYESDELDSLLEKLSNALSDKGDFPARANVVTRIKSAAIDPNSTIEEISELLVSEMSLGTRLLALVNSVFYQGARPITTISEAVMRVGMKSLTDICAGMVMMERFVPAAKRGGIFADQVKFSVMSSLIARKLADKFSDPKEREQAYLAGTFYSLGPLLLAFYFPQVFEVAERRASSQRKQQWQSVAEIIGVQPVDLSIVVLDALELPEFFTDTILSAHAIEQNEKAEKKTALGEVLGSSIMLVRGILSAQSAAEISELRTISIDSKWVTEEQDAALWETLVDDFNTHCETIDLGFLTFPEFDENGNDYGDDVLDEALAGNPHAEYLEELRSCINRKEPFSSILTAAMETLAFGLEFERVVLLLVSPDRSALEAKLCLGNSDGLDLKKFKLPMIQSGNHFVHSLMSGDMTPIDRSICADAKNGFCIPVGNGEDGRGVIYVDTLDTSKKIDLSSDELSPTLSVLQKYLRKASKQL